MGLFNLDLLVAVCAVRCCSIGRAKGRIGDVVNLGVGLGGGVEAAEVRFG